MVLLRTVFQAKFGKAGQVVAAMKAMENVLTDEQMKDLQPRVLTDISGSFDTIVMETTHESLAAVEQFRNDLFARQSESEGQSDINDLIVSGRNEYYTIEV